LSSGDGHLDAYIITFRPLLLRPHFFPKFSLNLFQVRYAGRFVDPALEFCTGINFFVFQVALIPFEVVAFNVVLQFWTDKIPVSAVICIVLLAYAYSLLLCTFDVDID
jgi:amino acid transporter